MQSLCTNEKHLCIIKNLINFVKFNGEVVRISRIDDLGSLDTIDEVVCLKIDTYITENDYVESMLVITKEQYLSIKENILHKKVKIRLEIVDE